MSVLLWHALLDQPSVESWTEIVHQGKRLWTRMHLDLQTGAGTPKDNWAFFMRSLVEALQRWPKEIPRVCPEDWPEDFKAQVEHRVLETGTYAHYIQKICTDPRLQLSDGSQAVWLERRFVGGVVPASVAQRIVGLLWDAVKEPSAPTMARMIRECASMLSGALRNTGKVGTADLTGGLTIELSFCSNCGVWHSATAQECNDPRCSKVLIYGRMELRLEVEVKVGDGRQRTAQVVREQSVLRRGGCYVLCNTVESAVQQILDFKAKLC